MVNKDINNLFFLKTNLIWIPILILIIFAFLLSDSYHGDPSIYLVYAKNIAKGDFFSFNPQEFSSGSTSPLWAMILGIVYKLLNSYVAIKILGTFFTFVSAISFYKMIKLITKNEFISLITIPFLFFYALFPSLMGYESPLIILLLSEIIKILYKINFSLQKANLLQTFYLTLLIASIPITRPDATIILFVLFFLFAIVNKAILKSLLIFTIASLPSILFFGYSYLETDSFSSSSYCRSFALSEFAISIGPISLSKEAILHFISLPLIFNFSISILKLNTKDPDRNLKIFSLSIFLLYYFIITFISPIASDVKRYLIPAITVLLPIFALNLKKIFSILLENKSYYHIWLSSIASVFPIIYISAYSFNEYSKNLEFDIIMERDLAYQINQIAENGDMILAYEVQLRYYLNDDFSLLSLDGITDGKVAKYLDTGNMIGFLKEYKPNYWVANDAVNYRKFLSGSILQEVEEYQSIQEADTITIENMQFIRILSNTSIHPKGFAGFTNLYKINYLD